MFNYFTGLLLLLAYRNIDAVSLEDTQLVLLQVTVRHGLRTPNRNYPNDTNQAYWDSFGRGQLLPQGMKQVQEYGAFIAKKYSSFLSSSYSPKRVYARSTDIDRTLQSAQAFLSGAYQPSKIQNWTNVQGQNDWLPIPVHTESLEKDNVLHHNAPCPLFDQLKSQVKASSDYLERAKINKPFIDKMIAFSGIQDLDQSSIFDLADKLLIQTAIGLPTEKYLLDNSQKLLELGAFTFNYKSGDDVKMAKFNAGGLINSIVKNMKAKISQPTSEQQFYLFSMHDTNVAALEKLFDPLADYVLPNFASGYVLELRNDSSGNYYVRMLFKNNKSNDPIDLKPTRISGCDDFCPFETFVAKLADSFIEDFEEACAVEPKTWKETVAFYLNGFLSWLQEEK